jgi:uncharacterized protein YegL
MPIFNDDTMEQKNLGGSHYGFSAKRLNDLGASEYTLVVIACDVSGSVTHYRSDLEKCVKEIVSACQHSDRADNLMLRLVAFNSRLDEVHGFRPLTECDLDKYTGTLQTGGMTALFDAAKNGIDSITQYGRDLTQNDYDVNAVCFVLTDGDHNASPLTASVVAKAKADAIKSESLESLLTILVGVNITEPMVANFLADFETKGEFDQYVELDNASKATLAKLAAFVSQSISSQSQALGTGGASQTIDPNSLSL